MVSSYNLKREQIVHVAAEMDYYQKCVQQGLITVGEYVEMSDLYLFPLLRHYERINRKS